MHCAWLSDCKCISKKASSLSIPIFFPFLTSLYVKQLDLLLDAATLCFYFVMMALLHAGRTLDLHGPVLTAAAANPLYAHFCPTRSPFLYFKWQRCRTSLLIFSFFILSPSLLCVCTSFPTSQCLFYVFWNYFSFGIHIWRMGSTRHLVIMSPLNLLISLLLCVTVGSTSMVTSPHPVHVAPFCLSSLAFAAAPSSPAPLCSIGTREGVTQKNLSGLLPIRDFRLDPSLLYSLPLLALSPNLLIVWVFLSIAYLLAKLRCSWAWDPLLSFFFLSLPHFSYLSTFFLFLFSLFPPVGEELFAYNAEFSLVNFSSFSKGPDILMAQIFFFLRLGIKRRSKYLLQVIS